MRLRARGAQLPERRYRTSPPWQLRLIGAFSLFCTAGGTAEGRALIRPVPSRPRRDAMVR